MTYLNRSRWGLGLMALMLLTVGLAGCGSEPAAVATPPAPPPAPPPFQPVAVEVALGANGGTVTLMTTEAGGHTLNGEAFASGTEVEGNGSTYTLTLDGTWSAAYKPPPAMSLALGTTGGELMIERLEDGSYQANGAALASGDTVTAENGNMYTVTISDDGTPSEAYVVPAALSIPLGLSGDTVAIVKNEDGTYSVNDEVITADTRVMAENGNVYGALLAPDGTPIGVMHIAAMQEVMLGELGGTITLTQGEDKAWWLGEMAVMDGDEYMAANGNTYTLTLDGTWSAAYTQPPAMSLALGTTGGELMIERLEDGSYQANGAALASGDTVTAENGNMYTVTISDDGTPGAAYVVPAALSIALGISGDTAAIVKNEDGTYSVNGEVLTADTEVTAANGNMYTVTISDDGTPIGVMHIAAMQEVMLGELGGTITLKQGEDKAWWLGEMAVMDGDEYMAANGNTYTLTLDGTWSAAYTQPPAMSLALGTTGGELMIERLEDGSYQANGAALASGDIVTAENGNMYTVTISDDGTPSEEYVVPAALSIPLGLSGDTAAIVKNEDGTYSVDGEVLTADTEVMAENGNVYGALLAPDGTPAAEAMYIAAMQEVMLGELGGTITLKQGEDKAWWLGEMAVMDGDEYTAGNGNTYVLMMDEAGTWSGMYQKVEVMVALGTQGSITLGQAEDMSWWYGTEGVMIGSEVGSANGNTYTLWYTDGVWTARFEPEAMAIMGTGLTAMSRESDDMYDVGDGTLPASGMGDVMDGNAMYHVRMQDGEFMGARFDGKIGNTNLKVSDLDAKVALSADNEKGLLAAKGYGEDVTETAADETGTYLKVAGDYYSVGTLLGSGSAQPVGGARTIVEDVKAQLETIRSEAEAVIRVFDEPGQAAALEAAMTDLWGNARKQVNRIFGTTLDLPATPRLRNDRVLDDLNDYIAALESEQAFADATAEGERGAFASAKLSSSDAANAFVAQKTESAVVLRSRANMRFGAAWKMTRGNATEKLDYAYAEDDPEEGAGQLGAFAYSTIDKETRVANIDQGTGSASYKGETQAVDGKGEFVSGDIALQVRFNANEVSGEVSNLIYDNNGKPVAWQFLYSNVAVDTITLPTAKLRTNNASWSGSGLADVNYVTIAGTPRPNKQNTTFAGQLLQGGNQAIGTWTFGDDPNSGKTYLAGSFGAERGADVPDNRPDSDDGTGMATKFVTKGDINDEEAGNDLGQVIEADGMLKITVPSGVPDLTETTTIDESERVHEIDLAKEFDRAGATQWGSNGDKFSQLVIKTLQLQREIIALNSLSAALKVTPWDEVRNALASRIFNPIANDELPDIFGATYSETGSYRNEDYLRAIDEAIDALASGAALRTALSHSTGIFYDDDTVFDNNEAKADAKSIYRLFGVVGPLGVDINLEKTADLTGRQDSRIQLLLGTTSFTRFGVWRREYSNHARQGPLVQHTQDHANVGQGPNAFGYSQLSQTVFKSFSDPVYPRTAVLNYEGETVAVQHKQYFSGDINIEVRWDPVEADGIWGTLSAEISNLENVASGLPLYHDADINDNDLTDEAGDDLLEADLELAALSTVRRIVIAGVEITTDSEDKLMFAATELGFPTGPEDGADNISIVHGSLGSQRINIGGGTIEGKFLGIGLNGPLAVLGGWSIANNADANKIGAELLTPYREAADAISVDIGGDLTEVIAPLSVRVGSVTVRDSPIFGAFGADLP